MPATRYNFTEPRPAPRSAVGPGLCTLLLAAFIFCKVAGVTAIAGWSWLWVLSPLWLPLVLFGVIAFGIVGAALTIGIVKGFRR